MLQICFFDDTRSARLMPLTLTKPSNMLRVGIFTISKKWISRLKPNLVTRQMPAYMQGVYEAPEPNSEHECLWINGRFLPDDEVANQILALSVDEGLMHGTTPVALRLDGSRSRTIFKAGNIPGSDVTFSETNHGTLLDAPWQVFTENGAQIKEDLKHRSEEFKAVIASSFPNVYFISPEQVFAGSEVRIGPGAVLDASTGPIHLADNATIMAGALIQGPVSIGEHATVKMGAKIYGDTTVGPWCKVGGELHNVVFQGYSNKAHDGFLGNSAIGEWCNLGADTNNSNLKNNYSTVRLTDMETGREYDTGQQFCGTIMGDHSKTAINTMLNTGTVCGVSSSIVSGTFPPKFIRSFRWISPDSEDLYRFDKAIETAEKVMARRGVELTPAYRSMMRHIFEQSDR
ncbi:MAG: glucose-1-phosphate thymidylyltransferase [Balneolia bacterium]|nr:glucose-1-phosphate thymidylyltransferase [Balneolia bacterium]